MNLAEFIQADLQTRLDAGLEPPCKLTYAALSKHYKVSLSPVRVAVEQLVRAGYLAKGSNGRLDVNQRRHLAHEGNAAVQWPVRPVDLEEVIRSDVIRDSFLGNGEYLREEAAAQKYGIGRTALRPILGRLAGQGLLLYVPRCGWKIRKPNEEDLRDYLDCREALELKALDLAAPKLDPEDLQDLLKRNQAVTTEGAVALDNSLHQYWIFRSDNRYIIDFFERHALYYTTLLEHAAPEAEVVAEMAAQHCDILRELLAGNLARSRRALSVHIRSQAPIVAKLIKRLEHA